VKAVLKCSCSSSWLWQPNISTHNTKQSIQYISVLGLCFLYNP